MSSLPTIAPPSSSTLPQNTSVTSRCLPWVEKYRPKTLLDVSHQPEIIATLRHIASSSEASANLPHLLLYGPPGTGKTSTALALIRDLWGPSGASSQRVLELNASDERGISVVRDKIKRFAMLAVGTGTGSQSKINGTDSHKKYPNPPYKIIILDEADTLTSDAQSALRRIMESTSRVTRFILICNYVSRIIEPLASRCAKFRFKPLPDDVVRKRVRKICADENVSLGNDDKMEDDDAVLDALLEVSGGDLRRAVTAIQSASAISPRADGPDTRPAISSDEIYEASYRPDPSWVKKLVEAVRGGSYDAVERAVKEVTAEGYPVDVLVRALQLEFIEDSTLEDIHKSIICVRIAECDKALVDGADEYLQLLDVCCTAQKCLTTTSN